MVGDDIAKDDDEFDGDDDEMAALNLEGIIEANRQIQANAEQMILDEIHEPSPSTTSNEAPPHPAMPHYCKVSGETHCEASTLMYMSSVNAIFNDMILNKSEMFCKDNYDEYVSFLKETMTYFGDMKLAQKSRKFHNTEKDCDKHFLDPITWRNLRGGICPFVYFAGYILRELPDKIEGFSYVPMLFSNQSPLEGHIGRTDRATIAG